MDDRHVEGGRVDAFGRDQPDIRAQRPLVIAPIVGESRSGSGQQREVERQLVDFALMRNVPAVREDTVAPLLLAQIDIRTSAEFGCTLSARLRSSVAAS